MLQATILVRTDPVGDAFVVACREGIIIVELDPWWTQLTDLHGIVLNSAIDDYRSALCKT